MLLAWRGESPAIENFATCLKELHSTMKEHLKKAHVHYKEFVDVRKKEQLNFQVGDKVWLLQCNIKTSRPYNKLDYHRI